MLFHGFIYSSSCRFIHLTNTVELLILDSKYFGSENKMLNMIDTDSAFIEWRKQILNKQLQGSMRSIMIREIPSSVEAYGINITISVPPPVGNEVSIKLLNLLKAHFLICKIVANNNTCFAD